MSESGPKTGHPLPESDEARHDRIPETLEREKGRGDDGEEAAQPERTVNPDGEPYPGGGSDEFEQDQREHQDRGQSEARRESDSA